MNEERAVWGGGVEASAGSVRIRAQHLQSRADPNVLGRQSLQNKK